MNRIVVIDGQGGGVGKAIVENIKREIPQVEIVAVGTNAMATMAMIKAGASVGATGENAVIYNCQLADIIVGPIGIIFANAILGEISPKMARAVAESAAQRVLVPVTKCHAHIVGIEEKSLAQYIEEAVKKIKEILI